MRNKKKIIMDIVDAEVVCAALGIDTKRIGTRTSILCPNPHHADRRFGSCYLTPKGCHCFAEGETFSAIKIVQWTLGCTEEDAIKEIADIMGVSLGEKESPTFVPNEKKLRMIGLSNREKEMIPVRFYRESLPHVYRDGRWTEDLEPDEEAVFEFDEDGEGGWYTVYKVKYNRPLTELANTDYPAFKSLIRQKCEEAMDLIREGYENPFVDKELLSKRARVIQDMYIGYGGSIKDIEPKKNRFDSAGISYERGVF